MIPEGVETLLRTVKLGYARSSAFSKSRRCVMIICKGSRPESPGRLQIF